MRRKNLLLFVALVAVCARAQTPSPTQPAGWQSALKAVASACKSDTPKVCPNMSTDTALACLQANIEKLSPGCKDAVTKVGKSALGF
jgi:hypothetical protein